jgi:hypothetical protein
MHSSLHPRQEFFGAIISKKKIAAVSDIGYVLFLILNS